MSYRALDPLVRPDSPLSIDFKRQLKKRQEGNNYHSSSLNSIMINPSNVNKTNLHPGGVEYVPSQLKTRESVCMLTSSVGPSENIPR